MNRAQRRRNRRRKPKPLARIRLMRDVTDVRQAIRCQDCDSEVTLIEVAPGINRAEVRHDDTCPWYAELRRCLA
jgi:hypothetical protein